GDSPKGGLDLTTRDSLLKGGDTGEVLNLEQLGSSRLLDMINHRVEPGMPFKRPKLSAAEIAAITNWVKSGATYDGTLQVPKWWSLQSLKKGSVPTVAAELQSWPRNPVDHFIAAAWPARQLGPNPPADKRTLLRRVYFDLI